MCMFLVLEKAETKRLAKLYTYKPPTAKAAKELYETYPTTSWDTRGKLSVAPDKFEEMVERHRQQLVAYTPPTNADKDTKKKASDHRHRMEGYSIPHPHVLPRRILHECSRRSYIAYIHTGLLVAEVRFGEARHILSQNTTITK